MKYLYYYRRFSENINRRPVSRETESNIWIKQSETFEAKINKKTMCDGSGYDATLYYYETDDLIIKYNKSLKKRKFIQKLLEMQKCDDDKIIDIILNIKLEPRK